MSNYTRNLDLETLRKNTFFLLGPRQTGKSSLLKESFKQAKWIDLLKAEEFRKYSENPERMREELQLSQENLVVIDEVQKVPSLLDEVHWLIENKNIQFVLCGSSARKLKRGHANLLGGRALQCRLHGLNSQELGTDFDLSRVLNHGTLPAIYQSTQAKRFLNAYVSQYLKEEIMAEGLIRSLPPFSSFLHWAALCDTEQINVSNVAREIGVSREVIRGYFEILTDTLLGTFLPPFRKRPKRRISVTEKFYFFDIGVVNFLAKRNQLEAGSELWGKAFENWVFHELSCYNDYTERYADFYFWQLSTGREVDFIINDMECAIECKSAKHIRNEHLKGLRELKKDHPEIKKRIIVSQESVSRETDDAIQILSVEDFLQKLWSGELF